MPHPMNGLQCLLERPERKPKINKAIFICQFQGYKVSFFNVAVAEPVSE